MPKSDERRRISIVIDVDEDVARLLDLTAKRNGESRKELLERIVAEATEKAVRNVDDDGGGTEH
jgi:hypothetical protein